MKPLDIINSVHPILMEYVNPCIYITIWLVNPLLYLYIWAKYFENENQLLVFLLLSFPLYIAAYFFFITRKVTDHPNIVRIGLRKILPKWLFNILFWRRYYNLYKRRQNPWYSLIFYWVVMLSFTTIFGASVYK